MNKVTIEEIAKLVETYKDKDKLRAILQHIFSHKENIDVFSQFFFPEVITNKIPDFHLEIYDELFADKNSALAAPRGHAKSSITGIIFLIYCIINNMERYIVYISQSYSKTVQFLSPIRNEFKNNDLLKFVYGDLAPTKSKDDDGKDREDCFDVNGIRVEAASFEKNIRGFKYNTIRPTLIICDDIESDERVLNPELRLKDSNKLNKIIIPSLDIKGRLKFIGTILHVNSLLVKKIKQYKGKIYRAIDDGKILWPDRFTKEILAKIKEDIGSLSFKQEYINDPTDNESSLIKREWVEACLDRSVSFEDLKKEKYDYKVLGVDFAFSDRVTADNSAFTSIGEKEGKYDLFHAELKHGWSALEQFDYIENILHEKYAYDSIAVEENSIKSISKDMESKDMPLVFYWTGSQDPSKSKTEYKNYEFEGKRHTVGKTNLIMRLGTAFETKQFRIPYKTEEDKIIVDRIIQEITSFALSDGKLVEGGIHPDYPIALAYALEDIKKKEGIIIDF